MRGRVCTAAALGLAVAALLPGAAGARIIQAEDILPPGQSGFVSIPGLASGTGSPHLQDQTPLFLKHIFKPAMFGQPAQSSESPRAGLTITRDAYGVPTIRANSAYNTWYGAGYAMAEDRLFQLELFRRATTGHLAEILGKSYVDMDAEVRRDFYSTAELDAQLAALSPALRARFQAMTDGINAWIAQTRTDPSKLPGEFVATGDNMANWKPEDSAAIGVYLARTVPSGDGEELDNARALRRIGPRLFNRVVPLREKHQVVTVPRSSGIFPSQPGRTRTQERRAFQRSRRFVATLALPNEPTGGSPSPRAKADALLGGGGQGHSNMWAIRGPHHTATFWNGPQLGFQIPELFIELELHGPGIDVRGSTAPGVPVIGIGHNAHVAWGLTSGLTDDDDLYAEKLSGGSESYMFKGRRRRMACHTETIQYRSPPSDLLNIPNTTPGAGSETERVCRTVHGPVQARAAGVAYARRYAIWMHEVQTLAGLADVNAARNIQDVNRAAAKLTWNENLMAADDRGHIGYWHPGLLQIKPRGYDERLPYPGTGQAEWRGFLKPSQRPHAIDPKQGFLFNWNNMPSVGWTQGDAPARERLLGRFHRAGEIRQRIRKAMRAGGGFDRTVAIDAFTGTHAQQRIVMARLIRRAAVHARGPAKKVFDTILRWDGSFAEVDSNNTVDPGVAAWEQFMSAASSIEFDRYRPAIDSVIDTRNSEHVFESSWGEVYALEHLGRRKLHAAARTAFQKLASTYGSRNPATWREPRRMYHPSSQGAASMPDIPFLDRGTFEQAVQLGA